MAYELDMTIIFDVNSKGVVVTLLGKVIYLPGPYPDRKAGVAAGEEICRSWAGWTSSHRRSKAKRSRRSEAEFGAAPGNMPAGSAILVQPK